MRPGGVGRLAGSAGWLEPEEAGRQRRQGELRWAHMGPRRRATDCERWATDPKEAGGPREEGARLWQI